MDDASPAPTIKPSAPTGTDWSRLAAMTDEDIARAVADDPDAAPILDAERLRREYRPHPPRLP
jgi:hypothetical protein